MAAINNTYKSARLLQSRRYTHDTYTDAQEAFTSTLDINASEIYIDANLIPTASLPFSGSGQNGNIYSLAGQDVVKYWYRQPLTKSDLNNEVWFFLNPSGSNSGIGAQIIDATPGYGAKVIVAGTQVSTNNYTFDYKTGVVQFATTAVAPSNGQVVTITAYQYVGRKLSDYIANPAGSLPSGLISSSAQVIAIFNANFTSGSTMATTVDTTFATDNELFVTSSNLDAGEF